MDEQVRKGLRTNLNKLAVALGDRQDQAGGDRRGDELAGDPAVVAGHHDPPDGSVNPTGSCRPGAEPGWP